MAWNDQPPRGHPMEPGRFPGPLYPPDATPGHTPSRDSPFVVACKRAAAHCGAWPWDPPSWDDSYSNRFAHGDNPDTHAGMAGLQRWSGTLDPTGWVGEKTFNFLRSVLIPQGRTHAGEPAWDNQCQALTQQAYDANYPPPARSTLRELALEQAITQLGVKESPPESNQVKYTDWYGMVGPWCAMFCTWCYETVGDSPAFIKGARYAYVPYIVADARGARYGLSTTGQPIAGDLVAYDWSRDGEHDHVGLFEAWTGAHTFTAIEGNTSTSNNSNGGEVMRRTRDVNGQGTVFVRVTEPGMSPDQLAALGAFLSGMGSVLSAAWYVKRAKRQARQDCDERLREFEHGIEVGRHETPPHDR